MLPMLDPHFDGLSASGFSAGLAMGWVVFCIQIALWVWALDPKLYNDFFCTGVCITWAGWAILSIPVVVFWGSPITVEVVVSFETAGVITVSTLAINIIAVPILRWMGKRDK